MEWRVRCVGAGGGSGVFAGTRTRPAHVADESGLLPDGAGRHCQHLRVAQLQPGESAAAVPSLPSLSDSQRVKRLTLLVCALQAGISPQVYGAVQSTAALASIAAIAASTPVVARVGPRGFSAAVCGVQALACLAIALPSSQRAYGHLVVGLVVHRMCGVCIAIPSSMWTAAAASAHPPLELGVVYSVQKVRNAAVLLVPLVHSPMWGQVGVACASHRDVSTEMMSTTCAAAERWREQVVSAVQKVGTLWVASGVARGGWGVRGCYLACAAVYPLVGAALWCIPATRATPKPHKQ